uniref:Uncharacterized protein n=1 Tax=Rhizophora mucronata TaxID=61149 RepID=A0A2P2Q6L3_RHIMU
MIYLPNCFRLSEVMYQPIQTTPLATMRPIYHAGDGCRIADHAKKIIFPQNLIPCVLVR